MNYWSSVEHDGITNRWNIQFLKLYIFHYAKFPIILLFIKKIIVVYSVSILWGKKAGSEFFCFHFIHTFMMLLHKWKKVFFDAGFQVISGVYVWQVSWLQKKIWQPIELSALQRCLFYASSFKNSCLMGPLTTLQLPLFCKIKLTILYNWMHPISLIFLSWKRSRLL